MMVTPKHFAYGEVQGSNTPQGSNLWTTASRLIDTLRTTTNAVNTPPGTGLTYKESDGVRHNGSFRKLSSGGAHFAFVDGHVDWVDEFIDTRIYSAHAICGRW